MYDRILVPTDGSERSVRAAEHALYLAREGFPARSLLAYAGDGRRRWRGPSPRRR